MTRSLKECLGFELEAEDGPIGTVDDLTFDDRTWAVRHLVATAGSWILGRQVVLRQEYLGSLDTLNRRIPISLTKDQIKDAPGSETAKPVSRHQQELLHQKVGGASMLPVAVNVQSIADLQSEPDQPHLRSVKEIIGYEVAAEGGDVGRIDDMLADEDGWVIRYLVVRTGGWFDRKPVVISPSWAQTIDWATRRIVVRISRSFIETAPEYDAASGITRSYEDALHSHYGMAPYW